MSRIQWVQAKGVTRVFGATIALRGVDARFEAGSVSLLEGPNGAGKSTLLAVIGTTLAASEGEVWYEPLGKDRSRAREEIGWVSHETQCYGDLTVRQNVELAARLRGVGVGRGWGAFAERLGLLGLEGRRVNELSRGQRQRVAIARALAHEPSLVLLDEPWTGLEVKVAQVLEAIVVEQARAGAVVIVVSHDPGIGGRLGARRIRLERGRVVEGGG